MYSLSLVWDWGVRAMPQVFVNGFVLTAELGTWSMQALVPPFFRFGVGPRLHVSAAPPSFLGPPGGARIGALLLRFVFEK